MKNVLNFYRKNTSTIILDVCDYQFNDGDTIYFTVKVQADSDETDDSALIKSSWTVGTDAKVLDNSTLELNLTAEETDIDYGQYFYDLKLVEANDTAENTLITGNININKVATLRV